MAVGGVGEVQMKHAGHQTWGNVVILAVFFTRYLHMTFWTRMHIVKPRRLAPLVRGFHPTSAVFVLTNHGVLGAVISDDIRVAGEEARLFKEISPGAVPTSAPTCPTREAGNGMGARVAVAPKSPRSPRYRIASCCTKSLTFLVTA